jgi:threonine aldolase
VEKYISDYYQDESYEHVVAPGMLYISHPTELGTLYTLEELEAISSVCKKAGIPLFLDGARLGYGLAAKGTDVTLKDIARLCDVFYIGGTKVGALFGEAVVVTNEKLLHHFTPLIKQHGALLAKGRLLGVQFETLFTDDLYMKISQHAIDMAMKMKEAFLEKGYRMVVDSPTNQQFFYLLNDDLERLKKVATFELWGLKGETETPVRFVTSWATTESAIDQLIANL